jgi:hypothetical protein
MVGGPTLIYEETEVTEDGFDGNYDGMGVIRHFYFISDACDAGAMDWSDFLRSSELDWMVIPCVSRSKGL